jgi:hypothetical protein
MQSTMQTWSRRRAPIRACSTIRVTHVRYAPHARYEGRRVPGDRNFKGGLLRNLTRARRSIACRQPLSGTQSNGSYPKLDRFHTRTSLPPSEYF